MFSETEQHSSVEQKASRAASIGASAAAITMPFQTLLSHSTDRFTRLCFTMVLKGPVSPEFSPVIFTPYCFNKKSDLEELALQLVTAHQILLSFFCRWIGQRGRGKEPSFHQLVHLAQPLHSRVGRSTVIRALGQLHRGLQRKSSVMYSRKDLFRKLP